MRQEPCRLRDDPCVWRQNDDRPGQSGTFWGNQGGAPSRRELLLSGRDDGEEFAPGRRSYGCLIKTDILIAMKETAGCKHISVSLRIIALGIAAAMPSGGWRHLRATRYTCLSQAPRLYVARAILESSGYDMMRPLPLAACLALAALSLAALTAQSQTPPPAAEAAAAPVSAPAAMPLAGNPEKGHLLTYTCQGCHGIAGYKNAYPNFHVPRIGGQSAEYLANALTEYKNGNRKHPTMQAQAQSFSEQDIADIAAFLSTVK